ncbi:MAG: S41 family peptidase [Brumimicrobium sp.]|nr:S41 family peptidase [Brumimicrobium sp.]
MMTIFKKISLCIILSLQINVFAQSNGFEVIKNLELIDLIYMNLDKYYVDDPKIGEISKNGIDAMLNSLDPYTVYYHEANIEDYRMMTTGQYGGIGALIRQVGDYVVIAEPYEDMPADKAGLRAGDKILSIDGRSMKGKNSDEVSGALKGTKGSTITIEYDRPGKGVSQAKVTRDEIKLPDIPYSGMVSEDIGYIQLNTFTQTASKNVRDAYEKLVSQGMKKVILDLRGNGGGLLIEAVDIVNFFVPKDQTIVKTKGRILDENRTYNTRNKPIDLEIPVVVLVNETSASASEIVAGSIQDLDRGVIIGNTTFGKGLVQRNFDLKYGSKIKITIAKYYTPSGRCVQKLDYYHKTDNKVDEIPDSLITVFKTKNGREVIDGRGIVPDIEIEEESIGRLTVTLIAENIIFDYATQFVLSNESIASPDNFKLSDSEYEAFKNYVLNKDIAYTTASEEQMKKLLKTAKEEGYEEDIIREYEALYEKVKASTKKDLELFEDQIKDVLQSEIVSRYYYQEGRVINSFQNDKALKEAIDVLNNQKKYKEILLPS